MDVTRSSEDHGKMRSVPSWARAIAKSRLVHFLAIGGVLWALAPAEKDDASVVRIGRDVAGRALGEAQARAGHALSEDEQRRVLADLVAERVLAAEGRRLGLGEDDALVRFRLADKTRASYEAAAPAPRASEEELRAEAVRVASRAPARIDLELAFVSKDRPEARAAAEALARALGSGRPTTPRDRSPVPERAVWTDDDLARLVAPSVADFARQATEGTWSPPLASAWGFYVARVVARRAATPEEVRAEAEANVRRHARAAAVGAMIERAAKSYRIEVSAPEGVPRFDPRDLATSTTLSPEGVN